MAYKRDCGANFKNITEEIGRERRVKLSIICFVKGQPKFVSELPSSQCKKGNTINFKTKSIDLVRINQLFRKRSTLPVSKSPEEFLPCNRQAQHPVAHTQPEHLAGKQDSFAVCGTESTRDAVPLTRITRDKKRERR